MHTPRALCLVLAGGKGSRLGPLTVGRSKPSLPVGGQYRLIDIALSNVVHSGLPDVWVLEQYEPHSLNVHLAGGRPWDLDRTRGGLRVLPPFQSDQGDDGFAEGNAEALALNVGIIDQHGPDVLVTMSADHLHHLDLRDVLATHERLGAAVTVVATDVGAHVDRTRLTVLEVDGERLTGLEVKPDAPATSTVATEVIAWSWPALHDRLEELAAEGPLGDYGDRLLPSFVDEAAAVVHVQQGHWADLGVPAAYLDEQLALLDDDPPLCLDDPTWPVLSATPLRRPAAVAAGAVLDQAWLSSGGTIAGEVHRSILGPGVVVEAGAVVVGSVLMADVVVRAGARVHRAVLADGVEVPPGAHVGGLEGEPVVVGSGAEVPAAAVPAGTHLEGT